VKKPSLVTASQAGPRKLSGLEACVTASLVLLALSAFLGLVPALPVKELTRQLLAKIDLDSAQVRTCAGQLADPSFPEADKAEFLIALKAKGETGEELGSFADAFIELAIRPEIKLIDKPGMDLCGTGGDRQELINVSTAAMFPVAAAGITVLKHGNRSITSRAGGADVLEALGIPVTCSPDLMQECLAETGLAFLFAPLYHPAFRVIAPIRKKLAEEGIATIFNLLGPLLNPMRPAYQLVGIFAPTIIEKYAVALGRLGRERAWVVHGQVPGGSGIDEISPLGETLAYEVKKRSLNPFSLFAEELGIEKPTLHELRGGDPAENARILTDILLGRDRSARRDFLLLNAAAALVIAGAAPKMRVGMDLAAELIDSGAAYEKLRAFQEFFTKKR
jgi:anthranilate phosphoribosyltransferase